MKRAILSRQIDSLEKPACAAFWTACSWQPLRGLILPATFLFLLLWEQRVLSAGDSGKWFTLLGESGSGPCEVTPSSSHSTPSLTPLLAFKGRMMSWHCFKGHLTAVPQRLHCRKFSSIITVKLRQRESVQFKHITQERGHLIAVHYLWPIKVITFSQLCSLHSSRTFSPWCAAAPTHVWECDWLLCFPLARLEPYAPAHQINKQTGRWRTRHRDTSENINSDSDGAALSSDIFLSTRSESAWKVRGYTHRRRWRKMEDWWRTEGSQKVVEAGKGIKMRLGCEICTD